MIAPSTWASVVTWQLRPGSAPPGLVDVAKPVSLAADGASIQSLDVPSSISSSRQILLAPAPEAGARKEGGQALVGALSNALPAGVEDHQTDKASKLSQSSFTNSADGKRSGDPFLLVSTNMASRPNTELDEAMARSAFNEDFVSVPTIQFASMVKGAMALSVIAPTNVGVVPVPEMSALFPIVGLVVAVSCTQILRRRRAAQQNAFRRLV